MLHLMTKCPSSRMVPSISHRLPARGARIPQVHLKSRSAALGTGMRPLPMGVPGRFSISRSLHYNHLHPKGEQEGEIGMEEVPRTALPKKQGLYDPNLEQDSCGVGLVANIKGVASHELLEDAITIVNKLSHRSAYIEGDLGDGVGMHLAIPDEFFQEVAKEMKIKLPKKGSYGVGNIFLHKSPSITQQMKKIVEDEIKSAGLLLLGWRKVPTNNKILGRIARSFEPNLEQLFLDCNGLDEEDFERRLYLIEKRCTNQTTIEHLHFCSLSNRYIVYKGLLTAEQFRPYFLDFHSDLFKSHYAMVHGRFSTNTFPIWQRAQPCRLLAHNGEINTLRGNVNYMQAREGSMETPLFGEDLQRLFPIIDEEGSDSFMFDNALQFLSLTGRSLPEAIVTMVPEAWQNNPTMSKEKRAFYEYNSAMMEPWDGPALLAFSDTRYAGAILDRNGLRPGRITETTDDRVILCSEAGSLPLDASQIRRKYRLQPGKIFLIDFCRGKIMTDEEVKAEIASRYPYQDWLEKEKSILDDLAERVRPSEVSGIMDEKVTDMMHDMKLKMWEYTPESINTLYQMAKDGEEVLGSMGNDEALAVLSDQPRILYDFFVQLFAQVTNPPIDSARESIVMSNKCFIGPEQNLLNASSQHVHRLQLDNPILSESQRAVFDNFESLGLDYKTKVIDCTFDSASPDHRQAFTSRLDEICNEAYQAVQNGDSFIVLSDLSAVKSTKKVPISSLLTLGAVHHYLLQKKVRTKIGIVVETADARDLHHFAVLLGYGADAIYPYMAYHVLKLSTEKGVNLEKILENYRKSIDKGILKVMSKMGISTLHSYKGAKIFEILGLSEEVVEKCFTGTSSRIAGYSFGHLADHAMSRYRKAIVHREEMLHNSGHLHWRADGELHTHEPRTIAQLQQAVTLKSKSAYQQFAQRADEQSEKCNLRGLFDFKRRRTPISLDEVEPAEEIVKRFVTGAMSYGSISIEAHETLAIAMNRIGAKSNTGEGGEDYHRYKPLANGESARSAIKQVASGRFGVTSYYLSNATDLQIKMAQGAKPGEGGELPGHKVTESIAETRHSTPGVGLISPPPHHDIYSIEDLAQLIHDLKNANPSARISVKLVSRVGVGVIAAGVAKCRAEHIVISGNEGGTGAARWSSIKHTGTPWELGIAETHQTLVLNGLRGRVRLQVDGGLKTGRDIVLGALLGAEEFGFSTIPLVAVGCIMMRKCHLNTCPVGIATQDPILRAKFKGQPDHVINYFFFLAEEVRTYMAAMGFKTVDEMVGRTDYLYFHTPEFLEERGLDLRLMLQQAGTLNPGALLTQTEGQSHNLEKVLDQYLIRKCMPTLLRAIPSISLELPIDNGDRSVGTMLSHQVTKLHGVDGLPDGSIKIKFRGSAGQSFGAWVTKGITLELEGDSNDGFGKGLCGGTMILYPPLSSIFKASQNVIVGNAALYGATSGQAFLSGMAAERFAVRNSGADAVVEGAGDHCCEYMTGGRVVVLGPVGRNFAAGMSGGMAFVWCPTVEARHNFMENCNQQTVHIMSVSDEESLKLFELVKQHQVLTHSQIATEILNNWQLTIQQFIQIYPHDYKKAIEQKLKEPQKGKSIAPAKQKAKSIAPSKLFTVDEIILEQRKRYAQIHKKIMEQNNQKVPQGKQDKVHGFFLFSGSPAPYRPVDVRVEDWEEVHTTHDALKTKQQSARCMDCGVPFCQSETGCPIHNQIPEWIDLVYNGKWRDAYESLMKTNNFPEFTGRVCPAPCEGACVLGVTQSPVTIKNFENLIVDKAFQEGWVVPQPPKVRTGKKVAIVGSGPAGLAAADQLNKVGHQVTVYERDDAIGGILTYGIPTMKLDKKVVSRRVKLLESEGIKFVTSYSVNSKNFHAIRADNDAVLLAVGATEHNDLQIPGRKLPGIHFAMPFLNSTIKHLMQNNNRIPDILSAEEAGLISARGKRVIVIGGGDTAADCIGTALRHGCKSLTTFEILPQPPTNRSENNPWPEWPRVFRVEYSHAEAQQRFGQDVRKYFISPEEFIGDGTGHVTGIKTVRMRWDKIGGNYHMVRDEGTEEYWEADLVLLAIGFSGPDSSLKDLRLGEDQKLQLRGNGTFWASYGKFATSLPGVFAAGDCRRGQSLVVWAINEGRIAASEMDKFLMQQTTLPGVAPGKAMCHPIIFDKKSRGHRTPVEEEEL
eukprot:TRINITY_DN16170_c0_g1_i1.p1 TRINITY_DN16170_c0_g1~~TRINITY_DN16170_c0_g1_i1.p1  ORF type:complete len:2167 (+),score=554.81 TRINITY_DN16170_c0_g1_i1:44-6544(+)